MVPVTAIPYLGSSDLIVCPPRIDDARRGRDRRAAGQDRRQDLGAERLDREGGDVERGQRRAAHRVDVADRVGRGDATEVVRVVDDRREEVDGLHHRQIVA